MSQFKLQSIKTGKTRNQLGWIKQIKKQEADQILINYKDKAGLDNMQGNKSKASQNIKYLITSCK